MFRPLSYLIILFVGMNLKANDASIATEQCLMYQMSLSGNGSIDDQILNIAKESANGPVDKLAAQLVRDTQDQCIKLTPKQNMILTKSIAAGERVEGAYYYRRFVAERTYSNASEVQQIAQSHFNKADWIATAVWHGGKSMPTKLMTLSAGPLQPRDPSSCAPKDLREDFGPVRDQDSIGMCYAEVAADFAGFYLQKKHPGLRVSSLDAMVGYDAVAVPHRDLKDPTWNSWEVNIISTGGQDKETLAAMNSKGVCSEDQFPMNVTANGMDKNQQIGFLTFDVADRIYGVKKQPSPANCHWQDILQSMAPQKNITDLVSVLTHADPTDIVTNLDRSACDGHRLGRGEIPPLDSLVLDSDNPAPSLRQKIDEALNRGKKGEPSIIGYNVCRHTRRCKDTDKANHYSMVIGRRWNKSSMTCEYLVRNSWGSDPGYYRDNVSDNHDGSFWIGQGELESTMDEATIAKSP